MMRKWLTRLRTALAIASALLLILKLPGVIPQLRAPSEEKTEPSTPLTLRVWIYDESTGTAGAWLGGQAAQFEKANKGIRVLVRRAQKDDWLLDGAIPPDMLIFMQGAIADPVPLLTPIELSLPVKPFLVRVGDVAGIGYAAPLAYTGNVLLINDARAESIDLIMTQERDYQEFAAQHAHTLVATPREARRLTALLDRGKGFPFRAEAHGAITDKTLLAGLFEQSEERMEASTAFLQFLLSDMAQNALPQNGLLPASETALPPDEASLPLLFALYQQIQSAKPAFP